MSYIEKRCLVMLAAIVLLCAGTITDVSAQADAASEVNRYIWDLSSLYPDKAAWEAERSTIQQKLKTIDRLKGTVGRDAKSLADALEEVADLRSRAGKMAVYGFLVQAVNTRSETAQTQYNVGEVLETQVEAAVGFIEDEIRAIDKARLVQWMREEPRLQRHRRRINRILRDAPHTLGPEAQAVVETMARWPLQSWDIYWALMDSDLGWPTIKNSEGEDIVVNRSTYSPLRGSPDRNERTDAAHAFLGRLLSLDRVFGLLLTRRIEADLTIARHRKFSDGIEALFFLRDGMPQGSHKIGAEVARANLATLHRYVELRRRVLGLDRFTYSDLYAPPPASNRQFTVAEDIEIIVAASAPLGAEYQARLRKRLAKPWMHLPPQPEKRNMYGIFPPVGGANPYTIMNYTGNYDSSTRFAGAATLMMAFADIPRDRAPETRDDPGIYSNGVLYVGNILHDDYLKDQATDRPERIAYLSHALQKLWREYFRWTIVAELEAGVQDLVMKGEPPTGAQVSQMYLDLLRQYYGQDKGIATVDDVFAAEWMIFRVPFLSYEQDFWPPAMAAACLLVEKLRAGDANARKGMHQVLGRGDLDLTYPLLLEAGIDMTTPEPYQAVIRRMNTLMDELEGLLGSE